VKNKNKISNIKETLYFLTNEENVEDNTYDPEWYSNKEGIKNIGFEGEYFGTVSNGEPHGNGKISITLRNHSIYTYEGEWKNGYKHGKGVLIDCLGNKCEGIWEDDEYQKPYNKNEEELPVYQTIKFDNGSIYQGFLKGENFHGYGFFELSDTDEIENDLDDDEFLDMMEDDNDKVSFGFF